MTRFAKRYRRIILVAIAYLVLVAVRGCSIYMRANRPVYRNVNVAQHGATRTAVVGELGLPERSEERNGKRIDTYRLDPEAGTKGTKMAVTSAHFIADAATLGLWEIVGTPLEMATKHDLVTYVITYSAEDRIESVQTYGSSPPTQENPPA